MKIIVISCNWKHDYTACRESVKRQDYRGDMYHIIVDSESGSDGIDFIDNDTILLNTSDRMHFLEAFYVGVYMTQEVWGLINREDVLCSVDGDDELYRSDALRYLSTVYDDSVWLTYGSYMNKNAKTRGRYCSRYTHGENYRTSPWRGSHLKSFRYGLYEKVNKEENWKSNGVWIPMAGDLALMFPMLEMSRNNQRYISRYMYLYNDGNPLSDHIVDLSQQKRCEKIIRSKPSYEPLLERPW